jgi:hypothetical protein
MCRSESPDNALATQPLLHLVILCNVKIVIQIDEIVITHLLVDCEGGHNQKQADQNIAAQDEGLVFANIHMLRGA